jgi:ADP-ribose pyrophosphatase YjhB (NUDIX family)
MTRKVTVRGIVLHEGKLLCVKLKPYKDHLKRDNSYWCLPGGGLDDGEALLTGVEREMVEETGIKPMVGNLLYVQQFAFEGKDYLEFFFHITNSEDYLHIDLTKTTHGMEEIEEIKFIDPAVIRVLPEFLGTEPLGIHATANGATKVISRMQ